MRSWSLLVLGLLACTRHDLTTHDLGDRQDVVAFFALLNDAGLVLRTTAPFGVEQGRILFGSRPQIELSGDESIAVLIELDHGRLPDHAPGYQRERAAEIDVEVEAPPPEPELSTVDLSGAGVRMRLPREVLRISAEAHAEEILRSVTLTLPVDPEHCRPTDRRFEPYGAGEVVLDSTNVSALSFREVVHLGDRVVIRAYNRVHVLTRGGLLGPDTKIGVGEMFGVDRPGSVEGLAIDPITGRVIATVSLGDEPIGHVVSISIDDPRPVLIGTATTVHGRALAGVSVTEAGRIAVAIDDGALLAQDTAGAFRLTAPVGLFTNPKMRSVAWDRDAVMAGARNQLQRYDSNQDLWDAYPVRSASFATRSIVINRVRGSAGEIWAGGSRGALLRWDGGLEEIELRMPPRYHPCGDLTEPFAETIRDIAVMGQHVYLVVASCSVVIAVRKSDGCTSLLHVLGDVIRQVDDEAEGLLAIDARDGELVVSGEGGRAFVLRP